MHTEQVEIIPTVKIKDCNVKVDGEKIATGLGDDYTNSCSFDYS